VQVWEWAFVIIQAPLFHQLATPNYLIYIDLLNKKQDGEEKEDIGSELFFKHRKRLGKVI